MRWIFLLLTLNAFAASDSMDVFEKSFPRDNTFCCYKGKRVEILIRGESKFTEPKERGYGELLFYRKDDEEADILKPSLFKADTFQFFRGQNTLCSKSHGYQTDDKTMAVLLLKEDSPFKGKLAIQLFDLKTLTPKEFIQSNYPTTDAQKTKNGFAFKTFQENLNNDTGKVTIAGQEYIYLEKKFSHWVEFKGATFTILPELTFEKLPWKKFFKDQQDFLTVAGWDSEKKIFKKNIVFYAVNNTIKKKCLLFLEMKQKLTGNESWRCQTI